MPLPALFWVIENGPPPWVREHAWPLAAIVATVTFLTLLKRYTSGATNTAERKLHGKVVILTGGTSGVGAQVASGLAQRGAQLVLLTQVPASDPFVAEYVQDLRARTNNQMIYAEHVDLASLHSVRKFATKWIDNAPPRRLDMVVLCAGTLTPPGGKRKETDEGFEETWMVNFLANFHLLGILSPALRAQPFDRDVRVIIATCSSYIGSPPLSNPFTKAEWSPGRAYARSKLALNVFARAFQKHLDSYKRPDQLPMNARVILVDPGLCRTPGTRRWLTRGSLWGLAAYLGGYLVPWFLLKSPFQGAQPFLHAAMEAGLGRGEGGRLIKECMEVDYARKDVLDEDVAKKLWEESDAAIERAEKAAAKKRAQDKAREDKADVAKKDRDAKDEIAGLVDAIKKGKQQQQKQSGDGKAKGKRSKKA
jgi:NAD(P)-dependent dehydrogenase (short-subunit alcohol dehydrogenase family)